MEAVSEHKVNTEQEMKTTLGDLFKDKMEQEEQEEPEKTEGEE